MPNEWIIDVLEDLRKFADNNALPELSEALEKTADVARDELGKHVPPQVSLIHASFSGEADIIGPIRRHA